GRGKEVVIGGHNRNGTAALQAGDPVQLPALAKLAERLEGADIIVDRGGEAVTRIERRASVLGLQIRRILRKRGAGREIDSVGGIVERLREVIGGKAGEAMIALH